MADYFTPTVVQPFIPADDITPLELLVLGKVFESEPAGDCVYFFASEAPSDMAWLPADALRIALDLSPAESKAAAFVRERLVDEEDATSEVELDLTGSFTWHDAFQDIVRRSKTVDFVTVTSAFTCSKMRPDGFGGAVTLITADNIAGKSTSDLLDELLEETETGGVGQGAASPNEEGAR